MSVREPTHTEALRKAMNVAVIGLGGIGGFLGAKLAAAYGKGGSHRIHFLARGAHLEAIRQRGLTLISGGVPLTASPHLASASACGWPTMDLVLLCVKGYDLDAATEQIRPIVGDHTLVLPLQNGVGKRERVEGLLGTGRIGDGTIYVSARIQDPGVVLHVGGAGRVVFGRAPQDLEALSPHRGLLAGAGIAVELVPNVEYEIWTKYAFLCALAGATALYGEPLGPILADPKKIRLVEALIGEVQRLAGVRGIALGQDLVARNLDLCRAFPPETKSSLLHDLEAGRPNELEWLLGNALQQGEQLGVPLPFMRQTYEGIRMRWRLAR